MVVVSKKCVGFKMCFTDLGEQNLILVTQIVKNDLKIIILLRSSKYVKYAAGGT
jgi:hypothetical protein